MKKLSVLLFILLVLASCGSNPDIGSFNQQSNLSERTKDDEQLFKIPEQDGDEEPVQETETAQDNVQIPDTKPESEVEQDGETIPVIPEVPAESAEADESVETDYPEMTGTAGDPEIAAEKGMPLPVPAVEPITEQPAQTETIPPPAPPPPVQQTPPAPPPPQPPPPVVETPVTPLEEPPPPAPKQEVSPVEVPDMPFQPVTVIPPLPEEANLPYSRTVRALVGQYIEIPFRGSGWVYLGEFGSRRGVSYDSRRMDTEGMSFIFRADAEGTYSLRFNRHDFIRDYILNDYVKVIVEQPPPGTGSSWSNAQIGPDRVYAVPRWPLATDPEPNAGQNTPGQSVPQQTEKKSDTPAATDTAQSAPVASSSTPSEAAEIAAVQIEDWLKKAREEYNAGRIKGALDALDQFMILFPAGSDEAFWLYGQSLEANNEPTRDIRLSLDYYRRLTREFPQSNRYDEARKRIAYLERFYFNIQ